MPEVAAELEVGTSLLYRWIGKGALPQTGERHFKKGGRVHGDQTAAGRRAMIQILAQKTGGSVRQVCTVLGAAQAASITLPLPPHGKSPTPTSAS